MTTREIYANPPIVLMAVEVRHPTCDPLERRQINQLSTLLRQAWPLPGEINEVSVEFQAGAGVPAMQQTVATHPRWTTRDRRTALTVRQNSLVIETTLYGSYERVRGLLEQALVARISVAPPAGVERIGLRYVDEIRAPAENGNAMPDWMNWVDSALLGPTHIGGELNLIPAANEGVLVFSSPHNRALVLRYGAQDAYAVQSTPELRRPLPPPGPLFKLDIDSYWQSDDEVPEFTVDRILGQTDALHEPVRGVFESLITDRLRKEVLRHD
ncbi:TIGR04255 family protein [Marisediminicola sp. LYQ134]|uniref:TIGR04255 family protein n=1 Tax=Marisediminicola sp. LYQ134 TaxID=3391061 RepID=UPI003983A0CA